MAMYFHSDVSSYESSSSDDEGDCNTSLYGEEDNDNDSIHVKQVVLPLECFYKKVLFDLLISRNDSFFNYCFEQIFSRKLQASINGESVTYDQLRLHFLSLRRAYYDAHHHHSTSSSSSSTSSSTSSISTLPHAASAFAPDGSVLKFGPFLANSTNGGREGYLAAHTILANLIMNNNSKWGDASPLLSIAQLSKSNEKGSEEADADEEKENQNQQATATISNPSSTSTSPRKRRHRSHHHHSSHSSHHQQRIRYNALVVTDTMEIQWMEGKEGECRKITKFERSIKRPSYSGSSSPSSSANSSPMASPSISDDGSASSSSSSDSSSKHVKQQRRC